MIMKNNTDYIHQLMTQKLGNIISATDEHYLDELIENDTVVREKWLNIQAIVNNNNIPVSNGHLKPVKTIKPVYKTLLVAAAFLGVCLGTIYLVRHFNNRGAKALAASDVQDRNKGIQLKLASGKELDLSHSDDTITIGVTRMSGINKTLVISEGTSLPAGINSIRVPAGQTYTVTLSDGSLVWLNSASQIDFPFAFDGKNRQVRITGEAYLEVSQNTSQPFLVNSGNAQVQVLGTSFNINNYDEDKLKVSLVDGSVRLVTASAKTDLKPGQQAILTNGSRLMVHDFDTERELSWRNGVYYFNDASLHEIAKIIPRWFGVIVKLESKTIGNERFTGRVERNQPVTQLLESLKATTTIQYAIDSEGTIHIK